MPYHIKKGSVLGSAVPTDGAEYYAGDNHWTNDYSKRKIYENKSDADAQKGTTITRTMVVNLIHIHLIGLKTAQ